MSTSLANKVAVMEAELLRNRAGLAGVSIVTAEEDTSANKNRIIVTAESGEETPPGTGIYMHTVTVDLSNVTAPAATIDAWLAEVDAANAAGGAPVSPTAAYTAAKAAFGTPGQFTITDESRQTNRETSDHTRRLRREYQIIGQQS